MGSCSEVDVKHCETCPPRKFINDDGECRTGVSLGGIIIQLRQSCRHPFVCTTEYAQEIPLVLKF